MSLLAELKRNRQRLWRSRRMQKFLELMRPRPGCRIIDLGGTPELWEHVDLQLDITLLNDYGADLHVGAPTRRVYRSVVADACGSSPFRDREFDIAFSNSVIEHLGTRDREQDFAREMRRLASGFWLQTPSIWFPIEAHCSLPGWWLYPRPLRRALIRHWRSVGNEFTAQQMTETRVLTRRRLGQLFPDGSVFAEFALGFQKSLYVYAPPDDPRQD